jgi:hypothetical protein
MAAKDAGLAEANAKVDELEREKKLGELNAALADFSEAQQEAAKDEIAAFKEAPGSVEINSILGKICTEMVRQSREKSLETPATIDVFSMAQDADPKDADQDVNIY